MYLQVTMVIKGRFVLPFSRNECVGVACQRVNRVERCFHICRMLFIDRYDKLRVCLTVFRVIFGWVYGDGVGQDLALIWRIRLGNLNFFFYYGSLFFLLLTFTYPVNVTRLCQPATPLIFVY